MRPLATLLGVMTILGGTAAVAGESIKAPTQPGREYPNRPIRVIDAYAPGGGTDFLARVMGAGLTARYGQPVIIHNRPGAAGNVGADAAAKATPDGYTLFIALTTALAASPSQYPNLPYDALKDFSFVTLVASGTFVLVVTRASPIKSVSELVALAKAKPSQLSYSSSGVGGPLHLAGELLKSRAGIQMLHVPYGGGAPAIAAVTAGEVQAGFGSIAAAMPLIKAGRVTALAITSAKRAKSFPELPTIAESGVPGYDVTPTYGMLAPAGTPPAIVRLLNGAINEILKSADVQAKFATLGLEATGSTPEAFRQVMQAELTQWAKVIKDANIKGE